MSFEISAIKDFLEINSTKYSHILQPEKYLSRNANVDLPYIVKNMQVRMRSTLFFFLNGSYWLGNHFRIADLIYPLHDSVDPKVMNSLLSLKDTATKVRKQFGAFEEFEYNFNKIDKSNFSNKVIASLFETFYREIEQIVPGLNTTECIKKTANGIVREQDYPPENRSYLSPMFELKKYADRHFVEFLKGFYLHGSLATMDYIPYWSDLDTFMIVNKETLLNPPALLELRNRILQSHKYLYQIDPHQLHGHLLISEFDLDYYPQAFFPTILFDYAKSFFDDNTPCEYKLRDCNYENLASFWNDAVLYFVNKAIFGVGRWKNIMGSREQKLFFHRVMTFPLFYLQAKGIYAYKKYSFPRAMLDFSDYDWRIIQEISSIMNQWEYSYSPNKYLEMLGDINPKILFLLKNKYYDGKYQLVDGAFRDFYKNYDRWIVSALKLSVSGWNNVSKE